MQRRGISEFQRMLVVIVAAMIVTSVLLMIVTSVLLNIGSQNKVTGNAMNLISEAAT